MTGTHVDSASCPPCVPPLGNLTVAAFDGDGDDVPGATGADVWASSAASFKGCPLAVQLVAQALVIAAGAQVAGRQDINLTGDVSVSAAGGSERFAAALRLSRLGFEFLQDSMLSVAKAGTAAARLLEAALVGFDLRANTDGPSLSALGASPQFGIGLAPGACGARVCVGLAAARLADGRLVAALQALSAMGHMDATPSKAGSAINMWVSLCILLAIACRRAGETHTALPAFGLLRDAFQQRASQIGDWCDRAWILRQVAACHLALGNIAAASESAGEALQREAADSEGSAASLRILLRVACRPAASHGDAVHVALKYVAHPSVHFSDGLCAGLELTENGLPEAAAGLFEALRRRLASLRGCDAYACRRQLHHAELSLWAARARALVHSSHAASPSEFFHVAIAPGAAALTEQLRHVAAMHVWNVACHATKADRLDVAVAWFRGLHEGAPGQGVRAMSAMALCQWCLGRVADARRSAEAVLAQEASNVCATVALLLSSTDDLEAMEAQAARAAALPGPALAAVLKILAARRPSPGFHFLEFIATKLNADMSELGPAPEVVASLSRCGGTVCESGTASEIVGFLDAIESLQPHPKAGANLAVRRVLFEALCGLGVALGRLARWPECALAFERAHCTLKLGTPDMAAEERQLCLIAQTAALLEQARRAHANRSGVDTAATAENDDFYARAADAAREARIACERLRSARQSIVDGADADRALPLVVLMEFEAKAAANDPTLAAFVCQAAGDLPLPPQCFLVMAQLAIREGMREAAMHSLRYYLRFTADTCKNGMPGMSVDHFAIALRSLVFLHDSRNESWGCFEEALALLRCVPWFTQAYPPREVHWLCAVAWGNGVHSFRVAELDWAQRWLGTAIGFLDFCPSLVGHRPQMLEAHMLCMPSRDAPSTG